MAKTHCTLILASVALSACEYMPGTDAYEQAQARRVISQMLIDPDSAQFRDVQSRGGFVCGEVNGKNRMGAYVGFVRFIVDTSTREGELEEQDGSDTVFDLLWQGRCQRAAVDEPRLPFNPTTGAAENLADEDPMPNSAVDQTEPPEEEFWFAPPADSDAVVDVNGDPLANEGQTASDAADENELERGEEDRGPSPKPPDDEYRPDGIFLT